MATDGSHVLWLKTVSGRQFSKITAKDDGADTVTVEDSFNIAAPGVDWAIGGKRATIEDADSRTLFVATNGAKAGWIIELETDQTINTPITLAAVGSAAGGNITLRGVPASGEAVLITQTINDDCFDGAMNFWRFERLQVANSNGTKTAAQGFRASAASGRHSFYRCIFGHATNRLDGGFVATVNSAAPVFIDCKFFECVSAGVTTAASDLEFFNCHLHDNDGGAITVTGAAVIRMAECIIARNGSANGAVAFTSTGLLMCRNCTIDGNTGSGLYFSSATNFGNNVISGNQITNNGEYGIEVASVADVADLKKALCDFNNFFGNTTGARLNISAGPNDTAVDPAYANAAADNFEISQATRAAGFPDSARTIGANQSNTNSFVDIGAAQRDESLGGVILGGRRRVR